MSYRKSTVFTPDVIAKKMTNFLNSCGNILDPCVGTGNLLKFINTKCYNEIDVFDINQDLLNKCPDVYNKNCKDFLKEHSNKLYDNIILNPPYIKIQELNKDYVNFLKKKFPIFSSGNVDLYYFFLVKCLNLLKEDGVMVSITPNSFLYNKSSIRFRKFIIENEFLERIIDFNEEKIFQNVSVYCCISIFRKKQKNSFYYNDELINFSQVLNNPTFSFFEIVSSETKLKDICEFSNGIATLKNKIFIHNEKLFEENCWKKITNGRKDKWIIFPYTANTLELISEENMKKNNPKTFNYLLKHKQELLNRDNKGNSWYSFGRSQGLNFKNEAIYLPVFLNPNDIRIITKEKVYHYNSIRISIKPEKQNEYNLKKVREVLLKNKQFIEKNSPKRGSGWINLSTSTLKNITIN